MQRREAGACCISGQICSSAKLPKAKSSKSRQTRWSSSAVVTAMIPSSSPNVVTATIPMSGNVHVPILRIIEILGTYLFVPVSISFR